MAKSFKKLQYKDEKGKTPSDYICELLNSGIDVIKLATYIQQIPNEGVLIGTALHKVRKPPIGIWVRRQGKYCLMYSYYKDRNEVCFLQVFKGGPKTKIAEAITRVKKFYNIK